MELPTTVKAYTGIVTTGVFLTGSCLNVLALFVICCYTRLSSRNLFLILFNVFLSNALLDVFHYPVTGLNIIQHWPDWKYATSVCQWSSLLENACSSVIVFSLLILSIDRYYITIQRKSLPPKIVIIFSFIVWAMSTVLHGIYSFKSNPSNDDLTGKNVSICNAFTGRPLNEKEGQYKISAIVNMICMVLSFALIFRVAIYVWRGQMKGSVKRKKFLRQEMKVTFLVSLFTTVFWLPKFSVTISRSKNLSVTSRVIVLTHVLASINSIMAGVISIMFSKDFRRSCLDVTCGCKKARCYQKDENDNVRDEMKEPLTEQSPTKFHHQPISSEPPQFVKGEYKTCDREIDFCGVSIDSQTLEEEAGPGCKNKIFEPSIKTELMLEQLDSKF